MLILAALQWGWMLVTVFAHLTIPRGYESFSWPWETPAFLYSCLGHPASTGGQGPVDGVPLEWLHSIHGAQGSVGSALAPRHPGSPFLMLQGAALFPSFLFPSFPYPM